MKMKTPIKMLKASLVGLFLTTAVAVNAQYLPAPSATISSPTDLQVGTLNDGEAPIAPTTPSAVFFWRPVSPEAPTGTTITLQASLTDDSAEPITFSSYIWYEITTPDGTSEPLPTTPLSETGQNLILSNLEPGYHKYRVYGEVDDNGVICQSEEFQDIIFFVLRPLAPTASAGADAITQFCVSDPSDEALVLTANVNFGTPDYYGNYANPNAEAFDFSYRWYAVNTENSEVQIDLPNNTETVSGGTHTLSVSDYTNLLTVGTYRFYVEVQYSNAIKNREDRAHALWTATVGGDTPDELTVTPQPGRPTITIESVTD